MIIINNYEIEALIEKILLITSVDNKTKNINAKLRRELSRLYHDGFMHGQLSMLSKEEKQELRAELLKDKI